MSVFSSSQVHLGENTAQKYNLKMFGYAEGFPAECNTLTFILAATHHHHHDVMDFDCMGDLIMTTKHY